VVIVNGKHTYCAEYSAKGGKQRIGKTLPRRQIAGYIKPKTCYNEYRASPEHNAFVLRHQERYADEKDKKYN
jgi:hypothetical protein